MNLPWLAAWLRRFADRVGRPPGRKRGPAPPAVRDQIEWARGYIRDRYGEKP